MTDDFETAKQTLRDMPFYREACQTESVMNDWSAIWVKNRPSIAENLKTRNAYRRMDWLFRGALASDFYRTVMSPYHVSAIDDFIKYIDQTTPSMPYVSVENNTELGRRLQFGDAIIRLSRAECAHYGLRQAVGSRWFENFVIQHGFTMEDLVYSNPFKAFYTAPGAYSEVACTNQILIDFHRKMLRFWR